MKRVLEIDVLLCPHCGGRRRIVAVYPGGPRLRDLLDLIILSVAVRPVSRGAVVACLLVLLIAPSATGQGRRTLADWQRDLRDPSVDVRARAAQALAPFDQRAVAALTGALGDSEYKVRASAAEALVKIGPGPVVPGMIEALGNAEAAVRANAAVVLGAFGPAAKSAVPALARALRDANLRVRELAGDALSRIASTGPNQPASFPLNCH